MSRIGTSTYGLSKFIRCSTRWRCRGISAPSTVTRPEVGCTRPMMEAMVVVLPAPLPPSSAVQVPGSSANEMASTAVTVL